VKLKAQDMGAHQKVSPLAYQPLGPTSAGGRQAAGNDANTLTAQTQRKNNDSAYSLVIFILHPPTVVFIFLLKL